MDLIQIEMFDKILLDPVHNSDPKSVLDKTQFWKINPLFKPHQRVCFLDQTKYFYESHNRGCDWYTLLRTIHTSRQVFHV